MQIKSHLEVMEEHPVRGYLTEGEWRRMLVCSSGGADELKAIKKKRRRAATRQRKERERMERVFNAGKAAQEPIE